MANNFDDIAISGAAVCSFGVLERSSRILSRQDSNFQELLSLFSLIEAIVLYEKLLYFPFGDFNQNRAINLELVGLLVENGVLFSVEENFLNRELESRTLAKKNWEHSIRAIGNIPSNEYFDEEQTLNLAYHHAFNADEGWYHSWAVASRETLGELFSQDGITKWKNNIVSPNVCPDERFLDWEILARRLARASFVESFGMDYVSDAIEQPVIQVGLSISQKNLASNLYKIMSNKFSLKIEELSNAGYSSVISIPPLVAMVLERSNGSLQSILSEAISLRDEFSQFRTRYSDFQRCLSAPQGKTLGELVDQHREQVLEVQAALGMLSGNRTNSRMLHEFIGGQIKPGKGEDEESIVVDPAISLLAIAKKGIEKWSVSHIQGRAQILFDTWRNVMNIENYHSLVSRKLKFDVKRDDYNSYKGYARAIEETIGTER